MNKKLVFMMAISMISSIIQTGNSIKDRLSRLETKVNTIIKNERNEWEAIKKLDVEIQYLEKECNAQNRKPVDAPHQTPQPCAVMNQPRQTPQLTTPSSTSKSSQPCNVMPNNHVIYEKKEITIYDEVINNQRPTTKRKFGSRSKRTIEPTDNEAQSITRRRKKAQ